MDESMYILVLCTKFGSHESAIVIKWGMVDLLLSFVNEKSK